MNDSLQSRDVKPDEIREDAGRKLANNPKDNLAWVEVERDLSSAKRNEAYQVDDKMAAIHWSERTERWGDVAKELKKLREQCAAMGEALKERIIVALRHAKSPEWRPTHKHYKGGLYRVLMTCQLSTGEELEEGVVYDDNHGHVYCITRARWESKTEKDRPRYQVLLEGDKR